MRILIVDDESLNRFLLQHMLEDEGYKDCIEAKDGEEALKLAEKHKPDLVLLDVMMPGISGFEVAPILKKLYKGSYLPIIFITALDDRESLIKCLEVGGDDFVSKPFDKLILAAKIRAHARTRLLSKKVDKQNQELLGFQRKVDREHTIVEHIFSNAIVNNESVVKFFDFKVSPAATFNGDLFLCEASPGGGLYYLVGDFTGHGLASAIGALPVTRSFQAMAVKGLSIGEMAFTLNSMLLQLLPPDMFFAAVIVEVDVSGKRLTIWNGGMPQMLLKSKEGELIRKFLSKHMALGILDESEFDSECEVFDTEHGDQLFACTDGLMEITNKDGKMLDEEGVEKWYFASPHVTAEHLYQQARAYLGEAEPHDDMTIAIYRSTPLHDLKENIQISATPFEISLKLSSEALKNEQALESIMNMINSQQGLNWIRSDLFTVLTEMFNNSLEHGLLHLDSRVKRSPEGFITYYEQREKRLSALENGFIHITLIYSPAQKMLTIVMKDSGAGFDIEKVNNPDLTSSSGRGVLLMRELCETIEYSEGGTKATATMKV
ncbi:fused response regulator/phosphatase [Alteromonas sp. ASW11-130]|uniref:fused response regulator/phosphatase n=1 Tax=Alteromonas sp. ASW11-130 TaxID=3015775 RepID=UPI002241AE65|nr:fused response regulator/phosphatase [Alteromonas sp. ASW11-130]MCW8091471.1 fused response regulator/phosphatase [Alteromonas sp. ASW11-130]